MDRALVVYESMFGNTEVIARAVAAGLRRHLPVDVVEVGTAPQRVPDEVALLVVGAPTHAFGLSRAETRRDAADRRGAPPVSAGEGVREWLEEVEPGPGLRGAAFATRTASRWVPGSAARAIGRRLRRRDVEAVVSPASFHVAGIEGPLVAGERERAEDWGARLGALVDETAARPAP